MIHKWKKMLFENAVENFSSRQPSSGQSVKLQQLEEKLKDKDALIAEVLADNIRLKKKLNGDL
jgi:hypothetical protein